MKLLTKGHQCVWIRGDCVDTVVNTSLPSSLFPHKISLHLHQLRPVGSETGSLVITCVTVHLPSLQERQAKQQEELRKQQRKQVEMEVLKKKEDEARLVGFLLKLTHHVQCTHQYCCPPQHLTASLASSASSGNVF